MNRIPCLINFKPPEKHHTQLTYLKVATVIIWSSRQSWIKSDQQCSNGTVAGRKCPRASTKKQETNR